MARFKAIIADDEEHAHLKLKTYLASYDALEIVAHAYDGLETFRLLQQWQPDVIFLDVQMPKLNGFEVVRLMEPETRPHIIFTTAYDEFAVQAFEVAAVDYLLKPFGEDRFQQAMAKFFPRKAQNTQGLINALEIEPHPEQVIPVRLRGAVVLLPTEHIECITTDHKMVVVFSRDGQRYWSSDTMETLMKRLNPQDFFRIHRSHIIHLRGDFRIESKPDGRLEINYGRGRKLPVAREPARELRRRFGF